MSARIRLISVMAGKKRTLSGEGRP